jgi:DNA-binding transcriptional LysR family regulator
MPRRKDGSVTRVRNQLQLRDLRILTEVVDAGSMSKAASRLNMRQPSISAAIRNLEQLVAVRLLDRSPNGVRPTIYASALLKRGHVVFDEIDQAAKEIAFLADPSAGELRIGCPESLSASLLPAIVQHLASNGRDVTIDVREANSAAGDFQELRERNIDLMLGRIPMSFPQDDMDTQLLFEDPFFVVAGAKSPLIRRRKIDFTDLFDQPWVLSPPDNPVHIMVRERFHAHGVNMPHIKVVTTAMHLRFQLMSESAYISVVPASLLYLTAGQWSIKLLPINLRFRLPVTIITLKNRTISPAAKLFIEGAHIVAKTIQGSLSRPL